MPNAPVTRYALSTKQSTICFFFFVNFKNVSSIHLQVLKVDPNCVKALFRRGKAEIGLKNYDEALKDLTIAQRLIPNNKNIIEALNCAKKYWKDYNKLQQIAYKDLFVRV